MDNQVFLDKNGKQIKEGDIILMTLVGIGSGECEIVRDGDELCLYEPSQGHYPLKWAIKREDMILELKIETETNK